MRLDRILAFATTVLLLVSYAPASAAPRTAAAIGSPNVTPVANLDFGSGSDIEFVTLPVTVTDEFGFPMTVDKDFALAGSYGYNGLQIIDITDPLSPAIASVYDCQIAQGDVQVFEREDKTYVTYTSDNGYSPRLGSKCFLEAQALGFSTSNRFGTFIADITDPYKPKTVSYVPIANGSHNQTVHPSGNFLYNSNSDLTGVGVLEVINITNLSQPTLATNLSLGAGLDSHDVTFNADGSRAYSAALSHTLILNTENPAAPTIIGRIADPAINIHHQSDPVTMDTALGPRTFLVITDELGGAAGNGFCPGGGLHVYDITGPLEQAPVKVGYWNAPDTRPAGVGALGSGNSLACTSHVLKMYPEQKLMTIAWYNAGVRVVDISGLIGISVGPTPAVGNLGAGMKEVGYYTFPNSDTWSVKTNRIEEDGSFYMYGNDINRGLDVYRFQAGAAPAEDGGRWFTPAQALRQAKARGLTPIGPQNRPFCVIPAI